MPHASVAKGLSRNHGDTQRTVLLAAICGSSLIQSVVSATWLQALRSDNTGIFRKYSGSMKLRGFEKTSCDVARE